MPVSFFPQETHIDFIGRKWIAFAFTGIMIALSIGMLATRGLSFGIDFAGGVVMEIRTEQPAEIATLRKALSGVVPGEIALQHFGDEREVMIRLQADPNLDQATMVGAVKERLESAVPGTIDYRKTDYVGPQVGSELIMDGALAMGLAFAMILLYIWFRFEWQFGVGAIVALIHDTILMMGFFAVMQIEFNLTSVAAILTIIGYSINDSVVIYDRIRENLRRYKKMPLSELLNISINSTLSRTVLTAGTTVLALLALVFFGGEVLRGFSLSVLFGVVIGTYSSIYIAAPLLDFMNLRALGDETMRDERPSGAGATS